MNGTKRLNIKPGIRVAIVLKKDQRSGNLTAIWSDFNFSDSNLPYPYLCR